MSPASSGPAGARFWLALGVTILVVVLALWVLDWQKLVDAAMSLPLPAIAAAAALSTATHLIIAVRWVMIVSPAGQERHWREALVALHAAIFNLVTPAAIGADVYRVLDGKSREGGRMGRAAFVVLERILGVWAYAAVYVVAVLFMSSDAAALRSGSIEAIAFAIFLAFAIVVPIIVIAGPAVLASKASAGEGTLADVVRSAVRAFTNAGPAGQGLQFALSFAAGVTWVGAAVALGGDTIGVAAPEIVTAAILTEFARLIPVSIQGAGVRESVFAWFVARAGGSPEAGFVVCAVLYAMNYLIVIALGVAAGLMQGSGRQRPSR